MHIVAMGVTATGKSTVAERLAKDLDLEFVEGDDLHPQSNIEKMSAGIPLDGGYFEVTFPAAFFKDNPKSLTAEWIDFYR